MSRRKTSKLRRGSTSLRSSAPDKVPDNGLRTPALEPPTKITVLLAHYVGLICGGVATLLAGSDAFEVCAETNDGPTARRLFERYRPRVVIVGPTLRSGEGLQLIKEFHKMDRKVAILMLSASEEATSVHRAWRAGALGYVTIFDGRSELFPALKKICAGDRYVSSGLEQLVFNKFAIGGANSAGPKLAKLSDREREIFLHIGKGAGVSEMAHSMYVSPKTIETYQKRIMDKLGLSNTAELKRKAARWANKCDWRMMEQLHAVKRAA